MLNNESMLNNSQPEPKRVDISRREMLEHFGAGSFLALAGVAYITNSTPAAAAPFRDISLNGDTVLLRFGDAVQAFNVFGTFSVTPAGVIDGLGSVTFPDVTGALIRITPSGIEIQYRSVILNVPTGAIAGDPVIVMVNGVPTSLDSILTTLLNENNFTGIGPLSDLSRALVAVAAFESTGPVGTNVKVAQKASIGGTLPVVGVLCDLAITAIAVIFILGGVVACTALLSACLAAGSVVVGSLVIVCAILAAICAALAAGLTAVVVSELKKAWKP